MSIIGIDLGGTKLSTAIFSESGNLLSKDIVALEHRQGADVGALITARLEKYLDREGKALQAIGVSVPGISHQKTGTVWAPNIPGWEDFPLMAEIKKVAGNVPVSIDSDRACSILGEIWQGNAKGCKDVIYLAVGTGIGAGILIDGKILRGSHDIAGAIGWMALDKPFQKKYIPCGCFEYYASGEGIAKLTNELLTADTGYTGVLRNIRRNELTAHHVFEGLESNDPLAVNVFQECIQYWGMAVANLISIFNPEKIIFGGGVFGPALQFLAPIQQEAAKWAQPISMQQVSFEPSGLGGDAAIYGAGFLALEKTSLRKN
jgi:glucokinase